MLELGVSIYPEQETVEEIENYLKLASDYGFTKIFTSMFSVDGTREEIFVLFERLTSIAHKYGMEVYGDCNYEFLEKMGASVENLSVIKKMGIDTLRLDGIFGDERDSAIIDNEYGIKIQLNASEPDFVKAILKNCPKPEKIVASYNFYPLRNTGADDDSVMEVNKMFTDMNIKTQIFFSSNRKGAHGPWPVSDGLSTIERHRDLPVNLQIRHLIALGSDEAVFGNAFATEEEFKEIKNIMKYIYVTTEDKEDFFRGYEEYVPLGDVVRLPLTIELDEDATDLEKDIIFNYDKHSVCEYYHKVIRSRWSRHQYRKQSIKPRKSNKEYFEKGDVLIINDNINFYHGEVHIVNSPVKNDGSQNLVGHVNENELFLLKYLTHGKCFAFIKAGDLL